MHDMVKLSKRGVDPGDIDLKFGRIKNPMVYWLAKVHASLAAERDMIKAAWSKAGLLDAWDVNVQRKSVQESAQLFPGSVVSLVLPVADEPELLERPSDASESDDDDINLAALALRAKIDGERLFAAAKANADGGSQGSGDGASGSNGASALVDPEAWRARVPSGIDPELARILYEPTLSPIVHDVKGKAKRVRPASDEKAKPASKVPRGKKKVQSESESESEADSDETEESEAEYESESEEEDESIEGLVGKFAQVPAKVFKVKKKVMYDAYVESVSQRSSDMLILYFPDDQKRWPFKAEVVRTWIVPIALFDPPPPPS